MPKPIIKYKVVKDLQGGEFLLGVSKTKSQWKEWALEDRRQADTEELYNLFKNAKSRKIIKLIEHIYSIKLKRIICFRQIRGQ